MDKSWSPHSNLSMVMIPSKFTFGTKLMEWGLFCTMQQHILLYRVKTGVNR